MNTLDDTYHDNDIDDCRKCDSRHHNFLGELNIAIDNS